MLTAKVSPLALTQAKIAINEGLQKASLAEGLKYEIEAIKVLSQCQYLAEGVQAFFEKRPPKFTGKY